MLTAPSFVWLSLFIIVPSLMVLAYAFRAADPYGGVGHEWTLATIKSMGNPNYPAIIWRTVWISVISTFFCVLISVPVAYALARMKKSLQQWMLLMIIIPFWTSFLVRIFAWKHLLMPGGLIQKIAMLLHLVGPGDSLLYNPGTVLLVTVYTFLPFAILPIFASAERFDFQLMDAARDLGATPFQAFVQVFLPGIKRGMVTAIIMVFIPALGSYIIPDVVGGMNAEMIGNKMAQRIFTDRNFPHACALASFMMITIILPLVVYMINRSKRKDDGEGISVEDLT
jgi:spermidine/putrescine transport system permease protein